MNSPQGSIHVARTVKAPQPEFVKFVDRSVKLSKWLLHARNPERTHVTLLETRDVNNRMRRDGYSPRDVRQFRGDLESHLSDAWDLGTTKPCTVEVDQKQPLIWRGYRKNKLALNIVPDDGLLTERWLIEEFLIEKFGEVPGKWPFEPHITLGHVQLSQLSRDARKNPLDFIPHKVGYPETIALNGLMASFDRYQQDEEYYPAA